MRTHRLSPLVLVALLFVANSTRAAETVSFQEGDGGTYSSTHATTIADNGINLGTGAVVSVVTFTSQALIRFPDMIGTNPGQVPPGATIVSATLTMTLSQAPNLFASNDIREAYYSWDEYTVTGASYYANAAPQYGPIAGTLPVNGPGLPTSGDASSIVQHWADGQPNHGILLHRRDPLNIEEGTYITQYSSDDAATITVRPKMTVVFTRSAVAVEPSTWGKVKALYR
jgi:hypothetical protein